MAQWIRANLPPGVRIANAATSLEYLTGHRNLNLHGVTSPGFGGTRSVEKEAGLFEALGRLPSAARPPYLLLARSGIEGSEVLPLLVDGPPLYETASLGDDLLLFRARWDLLGRGRQLHRAETLAVVRGLEEVDRLNVCDRVDEIAHDYRVRSRRGELELGGFVRIDDYPANGAELTVADAGRAILGEESFRVHTRPGRELVVVLRSHPRAEARAFRARGGVVAALEIPTARLVVRVERDPVARLELQIRPGWNEHVFRIPAEAIVSEVTRLRLSGQYTAFHYWFFQPLR